MNIIMDALTTATALLSAVLFAPALRAAEPTPWNFMTGLTRTGAVTVTTKTGKKIKRTGQVSFAASAVTFVETGFSVLRQDVKEVVIRRPRGACCDALASGVLPLILLVSSIGSPEIDKEVIPLIIIASPIILGMAAVTGPPLLVIEGLRRLKPTEVLYRVVP
jgi:hypothetical protein